LFLKKTSSTDLNVNQILPQVSIADSENEEMIDKRSVSLDQRRACIQFFRLKRTFTLGQQHDNQGMCLKIPNLEKRIS
jgi:hypothetical protein